MDQLLKQLGGGGYGNLQGLFGGAPFDNGEEEEEEELDDEAIMENARVVYDVFIQNQLQATSHSVQWLPYQEQDPDFPAFTKKFFLLGTHAEEVEEADQDPEETVYIASLRVPRLQKQTKSTIDYSTLKNDHSQLKIVKSFKHEGEVSKARAMKQNWQQFASILNTGDISLFNFNDERNEAVATLKGLSEEGFGLSWNPLKSGFLVAATGKRVCLWDVNNIGVKGSPFLTLDDAHLSVINDVKFSNTNENLFGTVSDDSHYKLWDLRTSKDSNSFVHCYKASEDELLVISFNQLNDFLFATGGEKTGLISIWDMRMPRTYINDLLYHKGAVTQLEWSPSSEYLLLSSGSEGGEVFIWDQSKCGEEQARHDYNEGPPEMIFSHEYHRKNNVEDIGWSPFVGEDDNLAVSVDTQLMMQVWKISEDFMFEETAFLDKLDLIKESDLE